MKLIVGLGNPGKPYERTRHNVGWRVLDSLPKIANVLYLKPQTFMNLSGKAVADMQRYYHITAADILIVYDDKDIPFGTVRFRLKGSSGGHNGMQSIIDHLGTTEIARLRIGIAPTTTDQTIRDTADYVLARFTKDEEKQLPEIIEQARLQLKKFIIDDNSQSLKNDTFLD